MAMMALLGMETEVWWTKYTTRTQGPVEWRVNGVTGFFSVVCFPRNPFLCSEISGLHLYNISYSEDGIGTYTGS